SFNIHWEVSDLAGNITTQDVPIQIILHALNGNLVSVVPDPDGVHLIISGAMGAAKPGITVSASSSFINSGSAVANSDGSFAIRLFAFTQAVATATDPSTGRSDTVNLS